MASGENKKIAGKIFDLLSESGRSASGIDIPLQVIFENLGITVGDKENISWETVLDSYASRDRALRKALNAIKRYKKDEEEIRKVLGMGPAEEDPNLRLAKQSAFARRLINQRDLPAPGDEVDRKRNPSLSSLGRYYREQERFSKMMSAASVDMLPIVNDSDATQIALGADTGVSRDFAYLAEEEKEQNERASRRSRMRRRQQANRMRLDMSDYELFIHEHRKDYGGRAGADEAFRKQLLKQMPPFFKDSKLSTKALMNIQAGFKQARETPIIGPMLHRMLTNPVMGASALGLGAILAQFQASDTANKNVVSWQNAANLYGTPSRKFSEAALMAGIKDPGQIAKTYGELTSKFGNAEMFAASIGPMLGQMDPLARTLIAKDLGLDDTTMALIDIMTKNGHLKVDEARKTNAYKNVAETVEAFGHRTGSGFGNTVQSWWLSIPGMTGGVARDMKNLDSVREGYMSDFFEGMDNAVDKSQDAAESLRESEVQGGPTSYNDTKNENHAVYIQKVEVASNSPKEFVEGLEGMSEGPGTNRALLASMGGNVLV